MSVRQHAGCVTNGSSHGGGWRGLSQSPPTSFGVWPDEAEGRGGDGGGGPSLSRYFRPRDGTQVRDVFG